jgi:hypothetical protein
MEAGWAPKRAWMFLKGKIYCPYRRQTPDHPSLSLITILTELAWLILLIDRDHKNFNIFNKVILLLDFKIIKIFEF